VGERFVHTEEVTGSNPVSPTSSEALYRFGTGPLSMVGPPIPSGSARFVGERLADDLGPSVMTGRSSWRYTGSVTAVDLWPTKREISSMDAPLADMSETKLCCSSRDVHSIGRPAVRRAIDRLRRRAPVRRGDGMQANPPRRCPEDHTARRNADACRGHPHVVLRLERLQAAVRSPPQRLLQHR
jgi:hypothetical protein